MAIFAVSLLLRLRLSHISASVLLGLFLVPLVLGFVYRNDEASTITVLIYMDMAWLYIALALGLLIFNSAYLSDYIRFGLLNRPAVGFRVEDSIDLIRQEP